MSEGDPMRWVWRAVTGGALLLGWIFILWQNKFHLTAPTVVICLGYLAVVAGVANLWRVGAAAVAPEDNSPEAWTRPIGPRGELEKEKKTLLKAIKEAEFDHAMGKLSQADADDLIRTYRSRAIEVIKELDRLDAGQAGSARDQIQREVQARIALEKDKPATKAKADKKAAKAAAKADKKSAAAKTDGKSDGEPANKKDDKPVEVETNPVVTDPVETNPIKSETVGEGVTASSDEVPPASDETDDEAGSKSTEATS